MPLGQDGRGPRGPLPQPSPLLLQPALEFGGAAQVKAIQQVAAVQLERPVVLPASSAVSN